MKYEKFVSSKILKTLQVFSTVEADYLSLIFLLFKKVAFFCLSSSF